MELAQGEAHFGGTLARADELTVGRLNAASTSQLGGDLAHIESMRRMSDSPTMLEINGAESVIGSSRK